MLSLLKNKRFYIHLALMALLVVFLIWLTVTIVNNFTRHGQATPVPDFSGLYYEELENNPEFSKFSFLIIDSIYDPTKERGTIINQDPAPESFVKEGRKIYLTLVAMNPKMVAMPELKDLSLRSATSLLQTYDLKVGKLTYEPDIAKNAVLRQYNKGKQIDPGAMILAGSTIDLVLGLGDRQQLLPVPLLIGLTRSQAIQKLHEYSLNMGIESFEPGDDTSTVRIYRQTPNYTHKSIAKFGSSVDVWYKSNKNFDFESYLKTIAPDTLMSDTL
ncbi:MAG: PASTA domain-containing protein [Bacteroidales bacterium]|nr:PASTA domain-containing protein [Bacteroidales bacterium]